MASHVRLTPLSGIGTVTGSVWHIQHGRKGFLIDFGLDLQKSASLMGKRLNLRDTRGLQDPIQLGLLPFFGGIYRDDLLLDPDTFEDADDLDVQSVLLTHFHADHGAQVYALDTSICVRSSLITAAFAHAHTVAGRGLAAEATHFVERLPHEKEVGILLKPRGVETVPRDWLTFGEPPQRMCDVWEIERSDSGLKQSNMEVAGLEFRAHVVDHSMYGTCAYEFLGPTRIVFATDFRRTGRLGYKTEEFINHMVENPPDVLILEATRLGREDDVRATERQAKIRIKDLVRGAGNHLVIAIVGDRHLERLEAFAAAASQTHRKLLVSSRVMLAIENVQAASPDFDLGLRDVCIYDPPMGSRPTWCNHLRERYADRLVSIEEVKADPDRFILAMTAQRRPDWIDLKPDRAVLIYSNSAAYSDEARGEHAALKLWTEMYQMRVEGISPDGEVDPYLCPSGHLHESDIREILERVKPGILIPVHCSEPELIKGLAPKGTRVLLPENGKSIQL